MNKIEEYLNSLDKKNLILLYASIVIAAFIGYYNFNYNVLGDEINSENNQLELLKRQLRKTSKLKSSLPRLKKDVKKLKQKNISLSEDLKYLNLLINSSTILHINEKNFLKILENVLQNAIDNNIEASYVITKESDKYKQYIIDVQGSFEPKEFGEFYSFLNNLEKIKAIKEIEYLNIEKKDKIDFKFKIVFWSLL